MSRTPEETARLANGVTVETPYHYPVTLTAVHHGGVMGITCSGWDPDQVNTDELIATLAADLAEARAEVAALREVAAMVREWQAASRASTITGGSGQSWNDLRIANDEREAIEARLLAATLPEVARG